MIDEGFWPPLEIPDAKLTAYLLNVDHPTGGSKARFFLSFGFHSSRSHELGRALLQQFDDLFGTDAMRSLVSNEGVRHVCEGPIQAPDGRQTLVRTVWQQQGQIACRLVTAYPLARDTRALPAIVLGCSFSRS